MNKHSMTLKLVESWRSCTWFMRSTIIAIGGITAENAAEIMRAGAAGVAVITAVVYAEDITAASRLLRRAVERGSES